MKKGILIIASLAFSFASLAQKQNIQSASNELKEKDYEQAKTYIEKAIADPSTATSPKAWFVRGEVYFVLATKDPKNVDATSFHEAARSFLKAQEYKYDEKEELEGNLLTCAFMYYNMGVGAYNDKKMDVAADDMNTVATIHNLDGGKLFDSKKVAQLKQFDTVTADAKLVQANCAFFSAKYDDAIVLLTEVKNDPITRKASVYASLIDAYDKKDKTAEMLTAIEEARKAYPDDQTIRNDEINYYIKTGKQDELVKKLQDAVAKDPTNAEFQYDLATTYEGMANPKDGKRPANAAELFHKADDAYAGALKIAPDNGGYNYNYGAMYYNAAIDYSDQMNAVTGNSPADLKKYDELKGDRDKLFDKSLPYLEKAYTSFSANLANLKGEDRQTYYSTLLALKQIYAVQNKVDKMEEVKKKIDEMNK